MPRDESDPPAPPLSYRTGVEAQADYVTPDRRSARNWILLAIVWIVGLGIWGLYIAMIVVLVYRWLG
jgi:hypothetical protein